MDMGVYWAKMLSSWSEEGCRKVPQGLKRSRITPSTRMERLRQMFRQWSTESSEALSHSVSAGPRRYKSLSSEPGPSWGLLPLDMALHVVYHILQVAA